jgi:D-xylose 1-dehydrogenase
VFITGGGSGIGASLVRHFAAQGSKVGFVDIAVEASERQVTLWLTAGGEQELMRRQCLERKLYPDDMARVVLLLATDDSGAMTNQTYVAWV